MIPTPSQQDSEARRGRLGDRADALAELDRSGGPGMPGPGHDLASACRPAVTALLDDSVTVTAPAARALSECTVPQQFAGPIEWQSRTLLFSNRDGLVP